MTALTYPCPFALNSTKGPRCGGTSKASASEWLLDLRRVSSATALGSLSAGSLGSRALTKETAQGTVRLT